MLIVPATASPVRRAEEERDRGHALERVAGGERLEALEVFLVVGQHRLGRVAAVAVADVGLDDDLLAGLRLPGVAVRGAVLDLRPGALRHGDGDCDGGGRGEMSP